MRRREFLGTATAGLLGTVTLTTTAAATGDSYDWRAKPADVTIEYDEPLLRTYQPKFHASAKTRRRSNGVYGYVTRSENRETTICYYWHQLARQDGLPFVSADSHLGDHEPCAVFIDEDAGEVEEIRYSAYHWLQGYQDGETANVTTGATSDPTHANMRVVDRWHQHAHVPEGDGALFSLNDWTAVRDRWINNGFYEHANPVAIENGWKLRELGGWWAEDERDALVARMWYKVGWGGADQSDGIVDR